MYRLPSLSHAPASIFRSVTMAALLLLGTAGLAHAAVPTSMSVEGFLSSSGGGAAADGAYNVTFSVYNVQKGGTAAWQEGPIKVTVAGGRFHHVLGAVKPFSAATMNQLSTPWLGLKVDSEPEMTRVRLRSVAYALLADMAKNVGFPYAGAKTKGGPATTALDLQCTGCVSVSEMKFDGDLDLGGNALKAKAISASSVSANTFQGDGSKLTGIKTPAGTCKVAGEMVKGINPDGSLQCAKAMDPKALPADGIDEISNFLIHNQFQNSDCISKSVSIKDNNPVGVSAELIFGDYGLSQKLDVLIDISNSDMSTVVVKLWDPNNTEYLLWNKSAGGAKLSGVWPSKTKVLKGDLSKWVNKNPKGKWRIQVTDGKFLNNGNDGAITKFCVNIQTLSNQKIEVKGDLIVTGDITSPGGVDVKGALKVGDTKAACDAKGKGVMKWTAGKGLLACDGANWVAALAKPVIFQGGCNSSPGQNGWYYRCMNLISINTAQDYLMVDSKTKTYNTSSAYGRVHVKIPGYYRITASNYGHSQYMQVRIYRSGADIGGAVNYHDNNRPRTVVVSKIVYLSKGQYIQTRIYTNNTNHHWHGCNTQGYSCHNWTTFEYLGNNL